MPPDLWKQAGFGLYIHWPYCQSKCPYCDFNSHVSAAIDQDRWADAYCSEIERVGLEAKGRVINSVYFGGGTPSLMAPEIVARVLDKVRMTWPMANDPEITLEANPTSVEAGRFQGYRDAGVTRISMGVQALNDSDLARLGRLHSVAEAHTAFDVARAIFERVSFDLIYARQDQTLSGWKKELGVALSMAVDHLSLYQLTIEAGTAFGDRQAKGGLSGLPGEGLATDMFFATQELCETAGMPAYETSNHAKSGAESQHNLIYWQAGDYAGIGPGAHGRLTVSGKRFATETQLSPTGWLVDVETSGSGESSRSALTAHEQLQEYLLMGLRVHDGVDSSALCESFIKSIKINVLEEMNLIYFDGSKLAVTKKGRPLLNAILRELLT